MPPSRCNRPWRALVLFVSTSIPLTACFEEPVAEKLRIDFARDGTFGVIATTTIAAAGDEEGNPSLARRLEDTRREYESGTDPWAQRFSLLEPSREHISWERREGVLVQVVRRAEASDHGALRRFLAAAGLPSDVVTNGVDVEFVVIPAAGGRASRSERDRVERALGEWTESVTRTYGATGTLYSYLHDHPERALPCIASLFSEVVSGDARRTIDDTNGREQEMLREIVEARRAVLEVFEVPEEEAFSLNELSHRVFDPFPARLEVTVPGEALEVEGFSIGGAGVLRVEGLGFFEALQSLAGRWANPDPIVEYVHAMRARGEGTIDLDRLLTTPPTAVAVTAAAIRTALVERLRPAPVYRVVFRIAAPS